MTRTEKTVSQRIYRVPIRATCERFDQAVSLFIGVYEMEMIAENAAADAN